MAKSKKDIEKYFVDRVEFFEFVDLADHLIKQIENKN